MAALYRKSLPILAHPANVTTAAFSPDAVYLATATADGSLHIWEVQSRTQLYSARGDTVILCISWGDVEGAFACGSESGNITSCAFSHGQTGSSLSIEGFLAHNFAVNCVTIKDTLIASGAGSNLRVWKWDQHEHAPWLMIADIPPPSREDKEGQHAEVLVTAVGWAGFSDRADFTLMAAYLHDGIFFYEKENWSCIRSMPVDGMIVGATISRETKLLSIANLAVGFDVYSLTTGNRLRRFAYGGDTRALPSRFTPDDKYLVCGSECGDVKIWDIRTGALVQNLPHFAHDEVLVVDTGRNAATERMYIVTGISDELNPYGAVWVDGSEEQEWLRADDVVGTDSTWMFGLLVIMGLTVLASLPIA